MRSDRQGIRAARFAERSLKARGHAVSFVDALEVKLPLLDRMYKEYPEGEAPAELETLAALYRAADAFVIVTGEYNHSVPPALTNLLDHFLEEYFFRPSAIVSYSGGQFGGVRAAVHLQAILCELGMPSIASTFPVPRVAVGIRRAGQRAHARRRPPVRSLRRGARMVRGGAEATAGGEGESLLITCTCRMSMHGCECTDAEVPMVAQFDVRIRHAAFDSRCIRHPMAPAP